MRTIQATLIPIARPVRAAAAYALASEARFLCMVRERSSSIPTA